MGFFMGRCPIPLDFILIWGAAPNPVHLFEKRWSQKLLISIGLVQT